VFYSTVRHYRGLPDEKNNLHLPGMQERDRPNSPENSFTRMFPDLASFDSQTDAAREQTKKLGEKSGPIDALDDLTDPFGRSQIPCAVYTIPTTSKKHTARPLAQRGCLVERQFSQ
jgi:hypothetical protein